MNDYLEFISAVNSWALVVGSHMDTIYISDSYRLHVGRKLALACADIRVYGRARANDIWGEYACKHPRERFRMAGRVRRSITVDERVMLYSMVESTNMDCSVISAIYYDLFYTKTLSPLIFGMLASISKQNNTSTPFNVPDLFASWRTESFCAKIQN